MFTKAILPDTFRAIQLVSKIPVFKKSYLAGGTALALQIGHRISVDLDFFTQEVFDENEIAEKLQSEQYFSERRRGWRTVLGNIGETSVSLFYYKYPLIDKTTEFEGLSIAGLKDITAMKIAAIADRGTRRDFVDLYFLSKKFSLRQMLGFYDEKYKTLKENFYTISIALGYFEDAEQELEMPKMIAKVKWEEVKDFFKKEVLELAEELKE